MELLWRIVSWFGLVVGLVVAAWGGGTLRAAAVHANRAHYRLGWLYFLVGWVVLIVSFVALTAGDSAS